MHEDVAPSDTATLERARSLANELVYTVALQCRRLKTAEPEDDEFVFRVWADWQFLIVALSRLRHVGVLAKRVEEVADEIQRALIAFDAALPSLQLMRNVGEHLDKYAIDQGHGEISRKALQVGSWTDADLFWLREGVGNAPESKPLTLNSVVALDASRKLHRAICSADRMYRLKTE